MGCENSKTVRVLPVGAVVTSPSKMREGATQTPDLKKKKLHREASRRSDQFQEYDVDEHGNKIPKSAASRKSRRVKSPSTKDLMGSCESLDDTRSMGSDRGFSATSKQSADSGLGMGVGGGGAGDEYANVITEFSEEDKIRAVEAAFRPRDDLELAVCGTQVVSRHSAKERTRQEEANIIQSLREEGLITKPQVQASGGMCFEIVDATADENKPKPPPRLEKLALERKKKKKQAPATEDEIRDKLERAERRRKKREQEKLDKIREMERTDAVAALENFTQYQRSKEETIIQRLDQASDNKERKIREMKEKLERRKRHAEMVRQRKQQVQESGAPVDSLDLEEEERLQQDDNITTPRTPPENMPRQHITTPRPEEMTSPKSSGRGGAFRMKSPLQVEEAGSGRTPRDGSNSSRRSSRHGSAGKSRRLD